MTNEESYRVLLTGATGFAGSGVLQRCLQDSRIVGITTVGRRALGIDHPKLTDVVHDDFLNQSAVAEHFEQLDAVYYCLGISQADVRKESHYREITYDYTMESARVMKERSPGAVIHFLSGAGTNANGRMMWARIKGEAERDLSAMGLGGAVHYRPGLIVGRKGERARYFAERLARPLEFLYRPFKGLSIRTSEFGASMIQATVEGIADATLENSHLRELAERYERSRSNAGVSSGDKPGFRSTRKE